MKLNQIYNLEWWGVESKKKRIELLKIIRKIKIKNK